MRCSKRVFLAILWRSRHSGLKQELPQSGHNLTSPGLVAAQVGLPPLASIHTFAATAATASLSTAATLSTRFKSAATSASASTWEPRDSRASNSVHPLDDASNKESSTTSVQHGAEPSFESQLAEIIETKVAPAIRADGGDIYFVDYQEQGKVCRVRLAGACLSCNKSTITLRFMVERVLKFYFPDQVSKVVNVESDDKSCSPP